MLLKQFVVLVTGLRIYKPDQSVDVFTVLIAVLSMIKNGFIGRALSQVR